MNEVKLNLNEKGHGAFFIMDGEKQLGEMVVAISAGNLTVYHTEVATSEEGKGLAKKIVGGNGRLCPKEWIESYPTLSLCSCTVQKVSTRIC